MILLTYEEVPTLSDWRRFLTARWRLLKRWLPMLRRKPSAHARAAEAQRKACRDAARVYEQTRQAEPPPYVVMSSEERQAYLQLSNQYNLANQFQNQYSPYSHGLTNSARSWLIGGAR